MFVLGILLLCVGCVYPPLPYIMSREAYDSRLQARNNFTNRGGFLTICGAILIAHLPRK